jgi:hypothetical protein
MTELSADPATARQDVLRRQTPVSTAADQAAQEGRPAASRKAN